MSRTFLSENWVRFYGILNCVLPFPYKCSSSSSVPLPSDVKGSVFKWLDQCLDLGTFLLLCFCFRACFLSSFITSSILWFSMFKCNGDCQNQTLLWLLWLKSLDLAAWETLLKRLQLSFSLRVDRSGSKISVDAECKNFQRNRCLIIKLKFLFYFCHVVFYIY